LKRSAAALALGLGWLCSDVATGQEAGKDTAPTNPSGFALPRYVSLKASIVNARKGPGYDYPVAWVYRRTGLPVEVVKEFDTWRQIRDSESNGGWVLGSLLSGRRTALILPWEATPEGLRPRSTLRQSASDDAAAVAHAEAGALAEIETCDKQWCRITVTISADRTATGYLEQRTLWGVYSDETIP
jgi:SH3-like domain-containing protein